MLDGSLAPTEDECPATVRHRCYGIIVVVLVPEESLKGRVPHFVKKWKTVITWA